MFYLSKPSPSLINQFLSEQKGKPLSYPEAGSTEGAPPRGYTVDHNRIGLGHGLDVFDRAKSALQHWKMFDMPWLELCWPDTGIEVGATVAVMASHFGFWSLNACRIVYVIETSQRYGFAYGTLRGHAEFGEERFTVEYLPDDQSVWYDVYALSRPGFVARIGYPFSRALQKRFAANSKAAMYKAISGAQPNAP